MTSHASSNPEKMMVVDLLSHLGAPLPPASINRYITSYTLTPLEYALLRLLLSFYAFFTIFFSLGYESTSTSDSEKFSAEHFLSYFTNLCYWGLAFYFLFAGLHGLAYHFTLRQQQQQRPASTVWRYLDLEQWPRALQAIHTVFYSSVVTFAPLVTIVFWAVIYKGPFYPLMFDAWRNISVHALNTIFALLEILLPCTPPLPILHLPLLILILLLYLGIAYLTHAISNVYVYDFLDTGKLGAGVVTGYCVAILAGVCVVFGVVWSMLWIKGWVIGDQQQDLDLPASQQQQQQQQNTSQQQQQRRSGGSGRDGAQGRTSNRRSGRESATILPYPARPGLHTRSVSGVTAVNDDDQDLEMGSSNSSPEAGGIRTVVTGAGTEGGNPRSPISPLRSSPRSPRSPLPPVSPIVRRGPAGEVIELDPVTSEFMRETAVGGGKK